MISEQRLKMLISDSEIYNAVLGQVHLGEKICSPIKRKDMWGNIKYENTPSFIVSAKKLDHIEMLVWKDFGAPMPENNDAIGLIQELHRLDREHAVQYIYDNFVGKEYSTEVKKGYDILPLEPVYGDLRYEEVMYYSKQYNITYHDTRRLLFGNSIYSLRSLYRGDYLTSFASTKGSPAFFWLIGDTGWKGYKPMQKKDKFRSHALYGHLEGYNMLPKSGDNLVIASGRKDSMAFNVIGYPSVAPTSENTVTALLKHARELNSRFRRVMVCFDSDSTGMRQQALLCAQTGWTPLTLPRCTVNIKDTTECLGILGQYRLREIIPHNTGRLRY